MLHHAVGSMPLRDRVLRGSRYVHHMPPVASEPMPSTRPSTYKLWTEERMTQAIEAVLTKALPSAHVAALTYDVPKSTLSDRISGRVIQGTKSGPSPYLTATEEIELVRFLCGCGMMGYAKSKAEVLAIVQRVLDRKGICHQVTKGWWAGFQRRNPELALRSATTLSQARSNATDPEMLGYYFDLLEETLRSNGLIDKPNQMFNMDESGMPLNPGNPKLVFKAGCKSASAIGSGDKTQITVVGCCSAAGFCFPPMVIWDRKTLSPELAIGEVPGTIYGLSTKGWIDQQLFQDWFTHHFLYYAPSARPLLLLLDGHSSHYCPDTIRFAAQQQVIIFALPPNTTHLSQPLDKGCFGPLKVAWKKACHEYCVTNAGKVVTRYTFSRLLNTAWMNSMTIKNIMAGFKVTGIYPLNRDAVLDKIQPISSLPEDTGLYLPLYSASPRPVATRHTCTAIVDEILECHTSDVEASGSSSSDFSDDTSSPRKKDTEKVMWMPNAGSGTSKILSLPELPAKLPTSGVPKSCGRVLTNAENIERLLEKQREKEEKEREKDERRRMREEKKRLKESQQGMYIY